MSILLKQLRLALTQATLEQRGQIAALVADRAVFAYARLCGIPEVEAWAARWLDGSDRTPKSARTAGVLAPPSSAVRHAAYAAYTASLALTRTTLEAAQRAARCAEAEQQMRDVVLFTKGTPACP